MEGNTRARILIVDDAIEIVQMLEAVLTSAGTYEIASCNTGNEAIEIVRTFDPDVVLLDLGLPGLDGIEVCKQLRSFTDAYVLMLTGRDDEVDRLIGLAVGADDYMTKPFSTRELLARIQVLLRRPRGTLRNAAAATYESSTVTCGDLAIDLLSRELKISGEMIALTKIEFDLISTLASRPEMVFTRRLLAESVWGEGWFGDDHKISVHIANLRRKIDVHGHKHIKTVRGVGYRMNVDSS